MEVISMAPKSKNKKQGKGNNNNKSKNNNNPAHKKLFEYLATPEDPSYRHAEGFLDWVKGQKKENGQVPLPKEHVYVRPSYMMYLESVNEAGRPDIDKEFRATFPNRDKMADLVEDMNMNQLLVLNSSMYDMWFHQAMMYTYWLVYTGMKDGGAFHLLGEKGKLKREQIKDGSLVWKSPWGAMSDDATTYKRLLSPSVGMLPITVDSWANKGILTPYNKKGNDPNKNDGKKLLRTTLIDLADILTRYDMIGFRTLLRMSGQENALQQAGMSPFLKVSVGTLEYDIWDTLNQMDPPYLDLTGETSRFTRHLPVFNRVRRNYYLDESEIQRRAENPFRMCLYVPAFYGDMNARDPDGRTIGKVVGLSSWMISSTSEGEPWNYISLVDHIQKTMTQNRSLDRALRTFFDHLPCAVLSPPSSMPDSNDLNTCPYRFFAMAHVVRNLFSKNDITLRIDPTTEAFQRHVETTKTLYQKLYAPAHYLDTDMKRSCVFTESPAKLQKVAEQTVSLVYNYPKVWRTLDSLHKNIDTYIWVPLLIPARPFLGYMGITKGPTSSLDVTTTAPDKKPQTVNEFMRAHRDKLSTYAEDVFFRKATWTVMKTQQPQPHVFNGWDAISSQLYLDRLLGTSLHSRHLLSTVMLSEHILSCISFRLRSPFYEVKDLKGELTFEHVTLHLPLEYRVHPGFVTSDKSMWEEFVRHVLYVYFAGCIAKEKFVFTLTIQLADVGETADASPSTDDYKKRLETMLKRCKETGLDRNSYVVNSILQKCGFNPNHFHHHFTKKPDIEVVVIPYISDTPEDRERMQRVDMNYVKQQVLENRKAKNKATNEDKMYIQNDQDVNNLLYLLQTFMRPALVNQSTKDGYGSTVDLSRVLPSIYVYWVHMSVNGETTTVISLNDFQYLDQRNSTLRLPVKITELLTNLFVPVNTKQQKQPQNQNQNQQQQTQWKYEYRKDISPKAFLDMVTELVDEDLDISAIQVPNL